MVYAGIDLGSLSVETVFIDENGNLIGYNIYRTGANSIESGHRSFEAACEEFGIKRDDIQMIIATGYGRVSLDFADTKVTEITCHGRGAWQLFPETHTVIDIGGQDSKAIRLGDKGKVIDFRMNDKCAAGTGKFLEVMASSLEVDLADLGELSKQHSEEVSISSMCTVFAESEVVSLIAKGISKANITHGLHKSISGRVVSMVRQVGIEKEITITGGVAKNKGVVSVLEDILNVKLNVPDEPQIVGAYGAALIALERTKNGATV